MLLIYGILLLVFFACPKYLRLVIFIINFFVPDPIPYADELVMIAGLLA